MNNSTSPVISGLVMVLFGLIMFKGINVNVQCKNCDTHKQIPSKNVTICTKYSPVSRMDIVRWTPVTPEQLENDKNAVIKKLHNHIKILNETIDSKNKEITDNAKLYRHCVNSVKAIN